MGCGAEAATVRAADDSDRPGIELRANLGFGRDNTWSIWLGGPAGPRRRWRRMERALTAMPSLSSSPRMRSVPQCGFSTVPAYCDSMQHFL